MIGDRVTTDRCEVKRNFRHYEGSTGWVDDINV